MTDNAFDLGFVRVWRDEEGMIRLVYATGASLTVKEIKVTASAMKALSEGKKRLVFVDARKLKNVDREARIYSLSKDSSTEWILAMATLQTPIVRILADLFTRLNTPPYPIKYFATEFQALEWLRSFHEESA